MLPTDLMNKYLYKDSNGKEHEFEFPRGKAPSEHKGMKRVFVAPSIQYKGSGWARNSAAQR
jgi:predicted nucleic acid-binding Zn ribbon protein